MSKPQRSPQNQANPRSEWQLFLEQLKKDKNPLYELLTASDLHVSDQELCLYFADEASQQAAQKKLPKIQAKLPVHWQEKRLTMRVGAPPIATQPSKKAVISSSQLPQSPLQVLNHTLVQDRTDPALEAAAAADESCAAIYNYLAERVRSLGTQHIEASFIWRLRVGGMRGFQEVLLPALHPVYGVPYIPASSLKGAARAWAIAQGQKSNAEKLLGCLHEDEAHMGCVQFLDAFPMSPSLSVDMANPQWHWRNNQVQYDPQPHALLSLEHPTFLIGLAPTSRGSQTDVSTVKTWLEQALSKGIGSRVSAGYGRMRQSPEVEKQAYRFELWSQGMYGAFPPQKNAQIVKQEFRPTAIRGVLRYWFRAVALGLYSPQECKDLESELFGTIDPISKAGSIQIGAEWDETKGETNCPSIYRGTIGFTAKHPTHLHLVEQILRLATHLSGVGRGTRRPLHWNNNRLRGCHWQLTETTLACNASAWEQMRQTVIQAFLTVKPKGKPDSGYPGNPKVRYQDVLNRETCILLVPAPQIKHPNQVRNWSTEGITDAIRGPALKTLYGNELFKGVNQQGKGNARVGGKLETPSFVTIKSLFPPQSIPYQVVTVVGVNQNEPDRQSLIEALKSPVLGNTIEISWLK